MADELLKHHNLNDWYFKFDTTKRRFWCCNYKKKFISISHHLAKINDEKIVKDTILHEIAHALAWHSSGHWKEWRKIAIEIWCNWKRCYWNEVIQAKMKYTAKCNNCKKSFQVQRKRKSACKECCVNFNLGKFSQKFMIIFEENLD